MTFSFLDMAKKIRDIAGPIPIERVERTNIVVVRNPL